MEYTVKDGNAVITRYSGSDTEVSVPESIDGYRVTEISDYAFSNCTFLVRATLPDTVERIGKGAFSGCHALETVRLPQRVKMEFFGHELFKDCLSLKTLTVPEGVEALGVDMFSGCTDLEQIILPDSVKQYGPRVFRGCKSLKFITLPAGISMIAGSTFEDSALSAYTGAINDCMSSGQAFVLKNGQNNTPAAEPKVLTPEEKDALAPEYDLGGGFILKNEKRLLRRVSFDAAAGTHVFRDALLGGEITVFVPKLKLNRELQNATDKVLAIYLLGIDTSLGLPKNRKMTGGIKEYQGITYGTCTYDKNGQSRKVSIAVCHGHALLVIGNIATLLCHLQPVKQTNRSAASTRKPEGNQDTKEKRKSFMSRVRDFFDK